MDIVDELHNMIVFQFSADELIDVLEKIKRSKENEIQLIKDKINKFEMKKRVEEAYYQSLSTFKKLFVGRPPSHHQAVEYLVNVKERFNEIEGIKQRIFLLNRIISQVKQNPSTEEFILSNAIIEEIRAWQETEDIK